MIESRLDVRWNFPPVREAPEWGGAGSLLQKDDSLPTSARLNDPLPTPPPFFFQLYIQVTERKGATWRNEGQAQVGDSGELVQDGTWEALVSSPSPLMHRVYSSHEQLRQAALSLTRTELSAGQQKVQVTRYPGLLWAPRLQLGLYLLQFLINQLLPYRDDGG